MTTPILKTHLTASSLYGTEWWFHSCSNRRLHFIFTTTNNRWISKWNTKILAKETSPKQDLFSNALKIHTQGNAACHEACNALTWAVSCRTWLLKRSGLQKKSTKTLLWNPISFAWCFIICTSQNGQYVINILSNVSRLSLIQSTVTGKQVWKEIDKLNNIDEPSSPRPLNRID